jgi:hypothetical protein
MNTVEFSRAYERLKTSIKTPSWEKDFKALKRQVGNDLKQLASLRQLMIERQKKVRQHAATVCNRIV